MRNYIKYNEVVVAKDGVDETFIIYVMYIQYIRIFIHIHLQILYTRTHMYILYIKYLKHSLGSVTKINGLNSTKSETEAL
jgi:hypothetical protein